VGLVGLKPAFEACDLPSDQRLDFPATPTEVRSVGPLSEGPERNRFKPNVVATLLEHALLGLGGIFLVTKGDAGDERPTVYLTQNH
jgi:hypothetical protein